MGQHIEYLIGTSSFKQPKKLTGTDAISVQLVRLILMEPGTDPLHPTMGVGLVSKYRYMFKASKTELEKDITSQIAQFCPQYIGAKVEVVFNTDHTVDIQIRVDDTLYVYDSSETPIPITLKDISTN